MRFANLALRFALELCAFAALGFWGWSVGSQMLLKLSLAIVVPLGAAIVWGLFVAPKAIYHLSPLLRFGVELLVFGAAVASLVAVGQVWLAVAFAVIIAINDMLLFVWKQDLRDEKSASLAFEKTSEK